MQCIKPDTRAYKLVNSYPVTSDNYPKVIEALKKRFGNKHILVELYVRKLLGIVISNARSKNKKAIGSMYDELESHLRALESLGVEPNNSAVFLYPLVESSLPEEIIEVWQRSTLSGYDEDFEHPTGHRLNNLMRFLEKEVQGAERLEFVKAGISDGVEISTTKRNVENFQKSEECFTGTGLFSGKGIENCIFCEKSHASQDCLKAQQLTIKNKQDVVRSKKCCFSCLKKGHKSSVCRTPVKCIICCRKHFTIMCPKTESEIKNNLSESVISNLNCSKEIILQTLLVKLLNGNKHKVVRALIDTGSQCSYILKKTALDLGIISNEEVEINHELFGGTREVKRHNRYHVGVKSIMGNFYTKLKVMDNEKICNGIPRMKKGTWMNELKGEKIYITDLGYDMPEIELLIGSDNYGHLITGKTYRLKNGLTAIGTKLGWTLMGEMRKSEPSLGDNITLMCLDSTKIAELWNLETIGINDPIEMKNKHEEEQLAKTYFNETLKRKEDGRYSVGLPWIEGMKQLPNNRNIAEKRLHNTTMKLKNMKMYEAYNKVFMDWLDEGIIEKVENDTSIKCFYLPHRAVIKMESQTTPIRPVFDASCKNTRNPSLNDCLYKGPNLLELIPTVLLRFREKKIGVTSDIRKAFQMIEIQEEDRDYVRFLWWEESKEELRVFRHRRVVFGVNSSPFLLAAVLEYHLINVEKHEELCAQKLLKSLYVDNCTTSVDNLSEYEQFRRQATKIMAEGMFELWQWEHTHKEESNEFVVNSPTSVLGLVWDKENDTLSCDVTEIELPEAITKRTVLAYIQKIFDPIGFTCPTMVQPKLIMQDAWAGKLSWDVELSEQIKLKFLNWCKELKNIQQICIPRNIAGEYMESSQLHMFSDASKFAYAAVVYLRTGKAGNIIVQLVQAKSRVAPIKKITIPRLELLGCTIGSRLVNNVKLAFGIQQLSVHCWTDSTTALTWIKRNDNWGTFVGNGVKEICNLTDVETWRYVPGILNPADLPSRGCTPKELLDSKWWEGPNWLKKPMEYWPSGDGVIDENAVDIEKKKTSFISMINLDQNDMNLFKFSKFWKNIRVIGWIHRFINKCRNNSFQNGQLTFEEIHQAEMLLWTMVQKSVFSKVGGIIEGIKVFKEDGLFKVKTKLINRQDTKEFRMPVLLPNSHVMVEQLIRTYHEKYGHGGIQFLMAKLRERYWILQGRRVVRKIVKSCVICRRFSAKSVEVPAAPLPENRVKNAKAFEIVGVDLAGPLFLKGQMKVWIVLYTCAVYRCVHLELVKSMGTLDFLLSLTRFISRRGRPSVMYSDNGTNFVGTENLFRKIDWIEVEAQTQLKQIKWIFNPPYGPWWGGFWERLIRSLKGLLRRMLGHGKLNYVELETCLCEAEAILNARPLTYITEDSEDFIALTPAMFLQDNIETGIPEIESLEAPELRKRYKKLFQLRQELRNRFRSEYLGILIQRSKEKTYEEPKVGDVVLVGSDNKKRLDWPMAIILEFIPGRDGINRVAWIKTTDGGKMLRPVQRLYKLEVDEPVSGSDGLLAKVKGNHIQQKK